jgi:glycosyltransferase involved in cell wall biosynthesis
VKLPVKASFITIVPSPYQRDLFGALSARDDIDLSVYYMEAASPDSPWPGVPLRSFERILPGYWASFAGARAHVNWPLPDLSQSDFVVLSSYSSLTGQWLMRRSLRGQHWLFWGERMRRQPPGWRGMTQTRLVAPLARSSGIVGIGREAEADYRRRFPHLPHFCIPYHCDLEPFLRSPRRNEPKQPLRFFFCGQMIARKGVDLLLIAFDRLVNIGHDIELLLVGREADLPAFMAAIGQEARARVRYEGFQAPDKLAEYFSQSDVFVLPSRYDGWGVVVNQALGAGLPVITTDAVGAGLDLVEPHVNGLLTRAGDVDSLQSAMEYLAGRRNLVSQWGEASRHKALTITPAAGAEKWLRVFESLSPQNMRETA